MDDLLIHVRRYAQRHDLWAPGDAIVAGVSGGPDSLCLLHLLRRLAPELCLSLHVAHLDHGLRGDESAADARVVADICLAWDLPYTIGQADVRGRARAAGLSIEEAARHERYHFLSAVAETTGATAVVVGHQADDQAETVLMHLLRGSGSAGMRGMLPRTRLNNAWLVRPLLQVSRSAIEEYCVAQGLQPRFDRTNLDTTFLRNRLRHELLPILEQYNPAIRETLGRTAAIVAGEYEVLEQEVQSAWQSIVRPVRVSGGSDGAEIALDLTGWRALPLGLQRATLRRAIQVLHDDLRNLAWEHVEEAVWLARQGSTGQEATLPAGLALQIGYRTLRIGPQGSSSVYDGPQVGTILAVHVPGVTDLGDGWQVQVCVLTRAQLPTGWMAGDDRWTAYLDAESVGLDLVLRSRQPGERFQPQGLGGHSVAIREFMIHAKVPRAARASWPVLAAEGMVAWICGLRVDERAAVRSETRNVWQVRLVRTTAPQGEIELNESRP